MVYYRVNTRVQMFYLDSNTFVPLTCSELAFWRADVDGMTFGRLFVLFPPPVKNTHLVFLFSFSLKTRRFLVTIQGCICLIAILTQLYLSNVLQLLFGKLLLTGCVWLTVSLDPNKISSRRLLS